MNRRSWIASGGGINEHADMHEKVLVNGWKKKQAENVKAKKNSGARRQPAELRVQEAAAVYGGAFRPALGTGLMEMAEKFGLRQETLSRMTGFSVRAVAAWASGKKPSAPVRRALTEMDRLLDALGKLMEPKAVGRWLKEPNPALDGSTPVQVIERGQVDRIWRLLYFVESGEPG